MPPPPRKPQKHGGGGISPLSLILRLVPLVLLPLLVAILQPDLEGGKADLKLVLLAAACGTVISAAVPTPCISFIVMAVTLMLLLSVAHLQALQDSMPSGNDMSSFKIDHVKLKEASLGNAGIADDGRRKSAANAIASLRWRPHPPKLVAPVSLKTFSVVLPCAFEGEFAEKTVWAIYENTDKKALKEIIVVDDGTRPPLKHEMSEKLLAGGPGVPPMRIVRHERTLGLISAKKSGGDAATGDVIVFFDCHVSPRVGWEKSFLKQMGRAGDHRTMVVPTITTLDPDTWQEVHDGVGGKAMYILWNNDFTWLNNVGRDVPIMSGGLLGLSRKWWEETGGYDDKMVAWGGENIDQSMRSWLCGGRIEVADGAYVAHMWRDPAKPKTMLRYPIPTEDVMRNKARAATAWFGDFIKKVMTFPEYEMFTKFNQSIGDMSKFDKLKKELQCAPFTAYLRRFSYLYFDGGLLPEKVYQIREKKTGLCLERKILASPPHDLILAPCAGSKESDRSDAQIFHVSNKDKSKKCCSGICHWNFHQCLDSQGVGKPVHTTDCEIGGIAQVQHFHLSDNGQLQWKPAMFGAAGCVAPLQVSYAGAARLVEPDLCNVVVEKVPGSGEHTGGEGQSVPAKFRLKSRHHGGGCGTAGPAESEAGKASGFDLWYRACDDSDRQQIFQATPMNGGFRIQAGTTNACFDSAGGSQVILYPCYDENAQNMNQVWQVRAARLIWEHGDSSVCLDEEVYKDKVDPPAGEYTLKTCSQKVGQRLKREDRDDGTFFIRDQDAKKCLARLSGNVLGLAPCSKNDRWDTNGAKGVQLRHVESGDCLDKNDGQRPILYPCHMSKFVSESQKFFFGHGGIHNFPTWGDNGRKRTFAQCLDRKPAPLTKVVVTECASAAKDGVAWERFNEFVPLERQIWNDSPRPPDDAPILGGDMDPP
eukprot:TRINITY_DN80236_c0_g1_i1.p1 TRINITY_DN80236_c0_g1~~TRINITY_DN80236_c0_g1_i1.p1  ORF type:complete len:930 (-),score=146.27 TRINITY_DN80236_c0_g1_i1:238-3027(-)